MNKRIAIIIARGGSKRIPHKNIIDFDGVPMLVRSIDAAKRSGLFHRIVVSTESVKISKVAEEFGIPVPFLRTSAFDDYTPSSEATLHALTQSEEHWGEEYSNVCQLMPNCPLRTEIDIRKVYEDFIKNECSSTLSAFKYGWMNPWWAHTLENNTTPTMIFPEGKARSQDLPELYCPSGAVWWSSTVSLKSHKTFYAPDFKFSEIPWTAAVDIDDYSDLKFANAVLRINND